MLFLDGTEVSRRPESVERRAGHQGKSRPGEESAFDKRRILEGVQDSKRQRMRSAITCGCSPTWMDSMATQIMR